MINAIVPCPSAAQHLAMAETASRDPFAFVDLPAGRSRAKPRRNGLTMMIDAGLPLGQQRDILELGAAYIDLAKIKTGSARLYPADQLARKLAAYEAFEVRPFLGGQFHEYVFATMGGAALPRFYEEALRLGFKAIEISDNVVPLSDAERRQQIAAAVAHGLTVFGEVGSKETMSDPRALVAQAEICFAAGAALVLVEAAELIEKGVPNRALLDALRRGLDMSRVMIELPGPWISGIRRCDIEDLKKLLIAEFGSDVNLANVPPDDIIDLETTRVGLGVGGPPPQR
jgi:phosphosulfolactate synthase